MRNSSHDKNSNYYPDNPNLYEKSIFSKMPEGVRPGGLMLTQRLVDYCNFTHGAVVLDIGCGTGITVEYLRNIRGLYALGIDLSLVLVQCGKERTADLQLIQSSAENMSFNDHSIDGVLAECSLSVIPNVNKVLSEINRILVPKGKLAITDLYIQDTSGYAEADHSSGIMTYSEISELMQQQGFHILVFEDQSPLLREFVARFIMENGSIEELWECTGMDKDDKRIKRIGYYLMIVEKDGTISDAGENIDKKEGIL